LEAELKSKYSDIETTLISSGGGVFEVCLNNDLVFSKKSLNRFPENGEIEKLINNSFG
jgi:selenoprotein W-related protein|tara:strand:- start:7248 stop:7421 length:174 start_codon:yes stop_codon:yes gene_type:complete